MRFVTHRIREEETRGRNGLHAVTKCAREESEECEKFHFMNVEVQKCFNFLSFALWGRRGTPTKKGCCILGPRLPFSSYLLQLFIFF